MIKFVQACGIAVSLALAACGGGVEDIKSLAKEACACKDKACGDKIKTKLEKATRSISSEEEAMKAMEPMLEAALCLGELGVDLE